MNRLVTIVNKDPVSVVKEVVEQIIPYSKPMCLAVKSLVDLKPMSIKDTLGEVGLGKILSDIAHFCEGGEGELLAEQIATIILWKATYGYDKQISLSSVFNSNFSELEIYKTPELITTYQKIKVYPLITLENEMDSINRNLGLNKRVNHINPSIAIGVIVGTSVMSPNSLKVEEIVHVSLNKDTYNKDSHHQANRRIILNGDEEIMNYRMHIFNDCIWMYGGLS